LWTGTAASWVDLHPTDATRSNVNGVYEGQQAGWAVFDGQARAGLWSGSAASWVDLHPAGATSSALLDLFADYQVGNVTIGGETRASLWSGSAASWEDLSLSLVGSWESTYAQSTWSDSTTLYVAGYGQSLDRSRTEAILWTRPIPPPSAAVLLMVATLTVEFRRRR
jgi:hypothetical protein